MNQAEAVRNALTKNGFVVETPPQGWLKKIQQQLRREFGSIHQSVIYSERRKLLGASGGPQSDPAPAAATTRKKRRRRATQPSDNGYTNLLAVKQFADKHGGIEEVAKQVQLLQKLFSN
jgi:hypothetical protein